MSMTADHLEALLRQKLTVSWVQVLDESAAHAGHAGANDQGQGTHFRVRIQAPTLDPLPRVKRHRIVYDALGDLAAMGIHALAIEFITNH